jgi:hypothetical protein
VDAYAVSAVAGGVLLAASLVSGHGGHGHGGEVAGDGSGHAGEQGVALQFLSLQLWTWFFAFGGAAGLLLRGLAGVPEPLCALLSGGVGLASALGARLILRRAAQAKDSESGTVHDAELPGKSGEVMVPFGPGATGKIRVRARGSLVDLLATTDEPGEVELGEEVTILEVKDGLASVVRKRV